MNYSMPPLSSEPLVSCLCVTEDRSTFMPWLLWNYDRQTWQRKELMILDSSAHPFQPKERADIRVISSPHGSSVARKRNRALLEASGEIVAWFDDDDWQHPERLVLLVGALGNGGIYAGTRRSWFIELSSRRCQVYAGFKDRVIFNSAGFRLQAVQQMSFPENLSRGSDTPWMASVAARYPAGAMMIERQDLFFWLCHTTNLSNPARRRRFSESIERLRAMVGAAAWGDTDNAIDELQSCLVPEKLDLPSSSNGYTTKKETNGD
jgi:hypothetical protein